tara:strand:+ start:117 stop:287 length:171 start_codon:yes stop_codon:yes gene_type:complete
MALGPMKVWTLEEVIAIRAAKKTMTVTELMAAYDLRRAQVCYALYYYPTLKPEKRG